VGTVAALPAVDLRAAVLPVATLAAGLAGADAGEEALRLLGTVLGAGGGNSTTVLALLFSMAAAKVLAGCAAEARAVRAGVEVDRWVVRVVIQLSWQWRGGLPWGSRRPSPHGFWQ